MSAGVYRFEGIDEGLDLVPLAGRRALDRAGRKLSLDGWRAIPLAVRRGIVEAGGAETVDADLVRRLIGTAPATPIDARPEPDPASPPAPLLAAGVSPVRWSRLSALDRWALDSLAHRRRDEAVAAMLAELV